VLKKIFFGLLLGCFFLTGCEDQQRVVVKDISVPELSEQLRDFAGLNGFRIRYANESSAKASFRIFIGKTQNVIPGEVDTQINSNSSNYRFPTSSILASNRQSTSRITTQETPVQVVDTHWNIGVQLVKRQFDVVMVLDSTGGFDPGQYARKFIENLRHLGYTVEHTNRGDLF